jgi:hypothetical protein
MGHPGPCRFFKLRISNMPVYEKEKPKRKVRFFPIYSKRKLNPETGKLEVDTNWTPQTLKGAKVKGVGKKQRKRPSKQRKEQIAA